jgi:hypothetical protein
MITRGQVRRIELCPFDDLTALSFLLQILPRSSRKHYMTARRQCR